MCFYAIPVGALEELGELITANNSSDVINEVKPDTEEEFVADAIGEMTNLREANTKHFRMTDGSDGAILPAIHTTISTVRLPEPPSATASTSKMTMTSLTGLLRLGTMVM